MPEFLQLLYMSGYITPITLLEITAGLLFLSGRFVPLGITLATPIIVNMVLYHIVFDIAHLPLALGMATCIVALVYQHWGLFSQFLQAKHPSAQAS